MSQGISQNSRIECLMSFIKLLSVEKNASSFIQSHKEELSQIIPHDVVDAVHRIMEEGFDLELLKIGITKAMNYLHKPLVNFPPYETDPNSLFRFLIADNTQLDKKLKKMRKDIIHLNKNISQDTLSKILYQLSEIKKMELHYTLIENVVFPILEKTWPNFKCVHVMWSIHDDIRLYLNNLIKYFSVPNFELPLVNKEFGKLYTSMYAIKFREEKILFPVMQSTIERQLTDEMLIEAFDFGLPFVRFTEKVMKGKKLKKQAQTYSSHEVQLSTGALQLDVLENIFNLLPVDITYVDENDTVVFFSDPPHRIFPRTTAIIGRLVQNCHPPESMHIVNQIIEEFKSGRKQVAEFWIQMRGRFIHITYYPVFSKDKKYKGVLEISQDATHLRSLSGEHRILDWE